MGKRWARNENKMKLQQFLIDWLVQNYKDENPLYLGVSHLDYHITCFKSGSIDWILMHKCCVANMCKQTIVLCTT